MQYPAFVRYLSDKSQIFTRYLSDNFMAREIYGVRPDNPKPLAETRQ